MFRLNVIPLIAGIAYGSSSSLRITMRTKDGCILEVPHPPLIDDSAKRFLGKYTASCPDVPTYKRQREALSNQVVVKEMAVIGNDMIVTCAWTSADGQSLDSTYSVPRSHALSPVSHSRTGRFGRKSLLADDGTLGSPEKAARLCAATVMIYNYFAKGEDPEFPPVMRPGRFGPRHFTLAELEDSMTSADVEESLRNDAPQRDLAAGIEITTRGPSVGSASFSYEDISDSGSEAAEAGDDDLADLLEPVITLTGLN